MPAREKKPSVTQEKRLEWLERNERGESPPHICAADGYDARTVRKYISIARQEREVKEARSGVLRNALERHYADLCRYAERLAEDRREIRLGIDAMPTESNELSTYEPELAAALRQHIPRSAIWKLLSQKKRILAEIAELTKEFEKKIESRISSDSRLIGELSSEETEVVPGIVAALTSQSQLWIRGYATLNVKDNLNSKPAGEGLVDLKYGGNAMGKVKSEHVELIGNAIADWTARFRKSENLKKLMKSLLELERVRKQLKGEVAVIVLRRVVPGRCRYCPL